MNSPQELLAELQGAARTHAPLQGLLALTFPLGDSGCQVKSLGRIAPVTAETSLTPAGTSALVRRFAIEKSLAGGSWVVARAARAHLPDSRCRATFRAPHEQVAGKAPDILDPTPQPERWAGIPPLTALSVRVMSAPLTDVQWEGLGE